MWSQNRIPENNADDPTPIIRQKLLIARRRLAEALQLLDDYSVSPAAATVDMAIHQLDRELTAAEDGDA